MIAYRLCSPKRCPWESSGRAGRWNSEGIPVLYAAASLSLACLEILVHIRDISNIPPLTFTEISIPDELVVPWQQTDGRAAALIESEVLSREFGDLCAQRHPKLTVYAVPSAIIPQETNYLIFPFSVQFSKIGWGEQHPFHLDPRLIDPARR